MLSGKLKNTQHIIYAAYDCLFWKRKVEENYYGIRKEEYPRCNRGYQLKNNRYLKKSAS